MHRAKLSKVIDYVLFLDRQLADRGPRLESRLNILTAFLTWFKMNFSLIPSFIYLDAYPVVRRTEVEDYKIRAEQNLEESQHYRRYGYYVKVHIVVCHIFGR